MWTLKCGKMNLSTKQKETHTENRLVVAKGNVGRRGMDPKSGASSCKLLHQFSSVTQSCPILCDPMDCSTPGLPVHHQLPEFTQTHVHWVGDAIQPSHPLSSPAPPAFNLSQHQGLFHWVRSSHQVAKVLVALANTSGGWSISFSISPSNEYSRLISFRMDWLDLLAVQGTLKRVLQHHSSKASILRCSAFFIVQLSCRERINNRVLLNSTEKYIQSPERNHNGKEEQKRMCVYNWVT